MDPILGVLERDRRVRDGLETSKHLGYKLIIINS